VVSFLGQIRLVQPTHDVRPAKPGRMEVNGVTSAVNGHGLIFKEAEGNVALKVPRYEDLIGE
jgi:hypothetical protein